LCRSRTLDLCSFECRFECPLLKSKLQYIILVINHLSTYS
jgi:hypothetical protein